MEDEIRKGIREYLLEKGAATGETLRTELSFAGVGYPSEVSRVLRDMEARGKVCKDSSGRYELKKRRNN